MRSIYSILVLSALLLGTTTGAKVLSLNRPLGGTLQVGDTLGVEIWASLDSTTVTGVNFYIGLPKDVFEVIDSGAPGQARTQPFQHGELFKGAGVFQNDIVSSHQENRTLLQYATLFAQQPAARSARGTGRVATLYLHCLQHATQVQLNIVDDPINETRLVLPGGIDERPFLQRKGLVVDITNNATATGERSWGAIKKGNSRR